MSTVAPVQEHKHQEVAPSKFEPTDIRIPFINAISGRVYTPETVIVAFKTEEIMREFFQSAKRTYGQLVVFDKRDSEPNSMGLRLRSELTEKKSVNDILNLLRKDFGDDKVSEFTKKYFA
jgi:hypothetical protein